MFLRKFPSELLPELLHGFLLEIFTLRFLPQSHQRFFHKRSCRDIYWKFCRDVFQSLFRNFIFLCWHFSRIYTTFLLKSLVETRDIPGTFPEVLLGFLPIFLQYFLTRYIPDFFPAILPVFLAGFPHKISLEIFLEFLASPWIFFFQNFSQRCSEDFFQ